MDEPGLFTARGRLLIYVMKNPGTTIQSLSRDLFLTRRTIWGVVGELRRAEYLRIEKVGRKLGRKHCYFVSERGLSELKKLTGGGEE